MSMTERPQSEFPSGSDQQVEKSSLIDRAASPIHCEGPKQIIFKRNNKS